MAAGQAHNTDAPSGFTFIRLGTKFGSTIRDRDPGLFLSTGRFVFLIDAAATSPTRRRPDHKPCPQLAA